MKSVLPPALLFELCQIFMFEEPYLQVSFLLHPISV